MRAYALEVLDDLVAQGVKALVIACNTASAAMLRDARERYTAASGIPVVEVIQPAVRAAVRTTRNGRVGVIGTAGTIQSRAYDDAFAAASGLELFTRACPRFVEFVEAGVTSGDELFAAAEEYLAPLRDADIDTLVLGCTHYPLMSAAIQYVIGPDVRLVSSAEETAADVYRTLVSHGLERQPREPPRATASSRTGDDEHAFRALAHRFLGPEVRHVEAFPTGNRSPDISTEEGADTHDPSRRPRSRRTAPRHHRTRLERAGRGQRPHQLRQHAACCARRASPTACRAG